MVIKVTIRATLLALASTLSIAAYARADAPKHVDISAGDLSQALLQLSNQYGADLVYRPEQVYGLKTQGIHGEFTTEEAVTRLLQGTPLELRVDPSGAILIAPPIAGAGRVNGTPPASNGTRDVSDGSKEGKKGSSGDFRVAQVDQGTNSPASPVTNNSSNSQDSSTKMSPLEEVVVTGTAAGSGVKKLEAGYAITTLNAAAVEQMAPKTTSEVLNAVPGIWVESSGGSATSNVFVRGIPSTGDAPFVTMQFDGVPVYGANSPSFMDQLAMVRLDETISTVEAVNGGPASVFSDGQPGLTTNLILKEGHDTTEGEFKVTGANYGLARLDAEMSGKIADDLYYMIGGYVASGDTIRKAGFDTEKGGQFTVNISKYFEGGKLNVFVRYTDDHGEWFLPFATTVPGLNIGTYNQLNNYTRYATIVTPGSAGSGATQNVDLAAGRGWKGVVAGGSLAYDLGSGMDFVDHFGVTQGVLQTMGLVPQGAGAETVTQALLDGFGTPGQTTVQTLHTGQTLLPTDYVQSIAAWVVEKNLRNITNDAATTLDIANNKITAGYYFSRFSSDDAWSLGNTRWMQVGGAGDLVNLNNGALGAFAIADSGTADINALYLADSWSATKQLRVDAAVREENQDLKFFINGAGAPAIPGESSNPHLNQSKLSWTVGTNYTVVPDLAVYARASEGHHFPTFDDVRSQLGQTATDDVLDRPWDVKSQEVGMKFNNGTFEADVTGFYDRVRGAVYNDVGVPPVLAGSNAYGVEFDGRWSSPFGASIITNDVWENSRSCCSPGDPTVDGKQAERIPSYQVRITPMYTVRFNDATSLDLFTTFSAIAKRYGDLQNLQPLPAFNTVKAGFVVNIHRLAFQLTGDNLTHSKGLTEGNPRSLAAGVPKYLPDVRPIFGRSFTGSVTFRF
jgi:iron complex outermembrane receptor protein